MNENVEMVLFTVTVNIKFNNKIVKLMKTLVFHLPIK